MVTTGATLNFVLIIDDDPILCAVAESYFQNIGVQQIRTADNGLTAVNLLDTCEHSPDLLLCDLNMPEMDGVEFMRQLRSRHFDGQIILVSGEDKSVLDVAASIANAHQLNILGSIAKPLRFGCLDELMSKVHETRSAGSAPDMEHSVQPADLRTAIVSGQIVPWYQPKIDARTGAIIGVEALARWMHPQHGLIAPSQFIPVAEQYGMIDAMSAIIIREAVLDLRRWSLAGIDISCAINLSAKLLNNIALPDMLADAVSAAGISASKLIFEITESTLLRKEAAPMDVLARMRLKGFDLSIDDFGTGNSNIEQLRDFPFCELKLDRSFVGQIWEDKFAMESVRASVALGRQLDLRLVAEGVETMRVRDAMISMGIDQIQGYLLSKPLPGEEFMRWQKDHRLQMIMNIAKSHGGASAAAADLAAAETVALGSPHRRSA